MTRNHILKIIDWLRNREVVVDEHQFFQIAYFDIYSVAEPRCELCFHLYIEKGIVPMFVRAFIQRHFVIIGGVSCK